MDPWVHIIGGGLSGLSLAASLAQFKKLPGQVVISEPNARSLAAKTFSFGTRIASVHFLRPEYSSSRWTPVVVMIMCLITGTGLNMEPVQEIMF